MSNTKRLTASLAAIMAGTIASMVVGAFAFACTILPAANISQSVAAPGAAITLTGTVWEASRGMVEVHWNSFSSGPLLAQVAPDANGVIGPVSLTVPASVEPGYYFVAVGYARGSSSDDGIRIPIQVTAADGVGAGTPEVALPGGGPTSQPRGVGLGAATLLAMLGLAGLTLFGLGTASLVRSRQRARVPVRQPHEH